MKPSTLLFLLFISSAFAKDYHIKSQSDFDALKRHTFAPADRLLFHKGKTFKGMFAPKGNGKKGAPIRIGTVGRGARPRIDALGKEQAGVLLEDPSFWEIHGLEITNTDDSSKDQGKLFGIRVLAHKKEGTFEHIHISDCYIHDINGKVAGKRRGGIHIHIEKLKKSTIHNLRIVKNRIEDVGGVGIGNSSSSAKVTFTDDDYKTKYLWTEVYVADNFLNRTGRNNIIARTSKDAIYERNTLANSSRYDTGHSIFCFDTDGIKIQYNEAYGNTGKGGKDRGGFDADYNCVNTFIQYNYSHDNLWFCGIMKRPNRHVVIRYNLSINEKEGLYFYGFNSNTEATDIHIYNNTHYTSKKLHASIFPEGRTPLNSFFENNIFYFEGKGSWGKKKSGPRVKFYNNLYYGIKPHKGDGQAITQDPRLPSTPKAPTNIDLSTFQELLAYRLPPRSAAIKTGTVIKDNGGQTFDKAKISKKTPHLGAFHTR